MAIASVTRPRAYQQRGTSVTEVIIATILLSTAAIGVSRMVFQSNNGLQAIEQRRGLLREQENARAIIGSWPPDEVTVERIEQLPFSINVEHFGESIAWNATVREIEEPVPALQVRLGIEITQNQQTSVRHQLTFWIPRSQATVGHAASDDPGARAEDGEPTTAVDENPTAEEEA